MKMAAEGSSQDPKDAVGVQEVLQVYGCLRG